MNEAKYRESEARLWQSVGLEPRESFIRLAGTGTLVRCQEIGSGEPVVFVHGGPNAGSTWAPMVQHFTDFRCLLVDRPGTGLSEPYAITRDNLATIGSSFLADLLDGMEIERAHVVASSFGGHLALRSAAAHPERVQRMVQMAAPALVPGERLPPFMRLMTIGLVRKVLNALPPNERANRSILRQIGHGASLDAGKIPQGFFDWYMDLARFTDTMRNEGEMIGRVATMRGSDVSLRLTKEQLASIETPTLFLWGEDDGFGGSDQAEAISGLMPNAKLVLLPASGHLPWLDDPFGVAESTAAFLRSDQSIEQVGIETLRRAAGS